MTATVLLTLGRLPKALEIARALAGAGCRVIVAEPFRRHVCHSSRAVAKSFQVTAPATDPRAYQRELLEIIKAEGVDLVVPVSEEALHVAALAGQLPAGVRLACPPQAELLALHDKLQFARTAQTMGLDAPETYAMSDPAALALMAVTDHVIKPIHSCSGTGVRLEKAGTIQEPDAISSSCLVQTLVRGRHVSSFTLAHEGQERISVLYEGTVFSGSVAVCFKRVDDCPAAHDWITAFVRKSEYSGAIAFDFIIDDSGRAWAIECNPRFTSGVHFISPEGLASALLKPESPGHIALKTGTRFQQGYSTLTEAYASFFRPREFFARLKTMLQARDVVWQRDDPLPFAMMTPHSWEILKPAIFGGISMGEAATRDIVWNGLPTSQSTRLKQKVSRDVSVRDS
jgi:predicted ATP-grasp superfamily ATP-dependent carboligase